MFNKNILILGTIDAQLLDKPEASHHKEDAMSKLIRNVALVLGCFTSAAFAAGQADTGGGGFLLTMFLAFCALIVAFQLIPAVLLFVGMVRGLFSKEQKEAASTNNAVNGKMS